MVEVPSNQTLGIRAARCICRVRLSRGEGSVSIAQKNLHRTVCVICGGDIQLAVTVKVGRHNIGESVAGSVRDPGLQGPVRIRKINNYPRNCVSILPGHNVRDSVSIKVAGGDAVGVPVVAETIRQEIAHTRTQASVTIAFEIHEAVVVVGFDNVHQAVAIEIGDHRSSPGITAGTVAHSRNHERAVAISQ